MLSPGIVILAAGSSSRLGKPKQLLQFEGTTLIQRIVEMAIRVVKQPVVVVLGAHYDLIYPQLTYLPVHIENNPDWALGLSTSIRKGLQSMLSFSPDTEAVIFAVCDQPHISPDLFTEMISAGIKSQKPIVACSYNNILGTPVLIRKAFFNELLALKDHEGAKKIIQSHPESVEAVSFPLGYVDIDTMQDYAALQKKVT